MGISAQTQHFECRYRVASACPRWRRQFRVGDVIANFGRPDARLVAGVAGRWGTVAHLCRVNTHDLNPAECFGVGPLLSVADLSGLIGIPVSTIYDWRTHGKGPVAYRFGKHLKYATADVTAWMAGQRDDARTVTARRATGGGVR